MQTALTCFSAISGGVSRQEKNFDNFDDILPCISCKPVLATQWY